MSGNRWRLPVLVAVLATAIGVAAVPAEGASTESSPAVSVAAGKINLGYFVQWGVYQRAYHADQLRAPCHSSSSPH